MTRRVVYLLGAGASHACIKYRQLAHGILMRDLTQDIANEITREKAPFCQSSSIVNFINNLADGDIDIEQVITFFDDSGSYQHKQFARALRDAFRTSLSRKLDRNATDHGSPPTELYAALIDMHRVKDSDEQLAGILTLNYDDLLEHAIEVRHNLRVDYGVFTGSCNTDAEAIAVLKLHGSFTWIRTWPIQLHAGSEQPLWIPPGIQKAKSGYPFNAIWGLARTLLDCDIVRIIGCNLGPNDWDLISMLFASQHTHNTRDDQEIEIIARPTTALKIRRTFPYLNVKTLLQLDNIGAQIVGEVLNIDPCTFDSLDDEQQRAAETRTDTAAGNAFYYWLKQQAEWMHRSTGVKTTTGYLERLLMESH